MDVYRALNADVPQLLFTIMHQATPTVSVEEYTRKVLDLHTEIRHQAEAMTGELHTWIQQQCAQQAEEMVRKFQRLGILAEQADLEQAGEFLERDYSRLASRLGSQALLGMQGSGEEVLNDDIPAIPDLAERVVEGRQYLASLGFQPGKGIISESWLLFRGSMHYDIMEHVTRNRLGIYKGMYADHLSSVAGALFSTYNLIYQVGEGLTFTLTEDMPTQEISFAFNKGPDHSSLFLQEVAALMEEIADPIPLLHASFWRRKLGLGAGKEFTLRLRLPAGEEYVQEAITTIEHAGQVGAETLVKRGKILLGKRVL
jgi:hypothetical protein